MTNKVLLWAKLKVFKFNFFMFLFKQKNKHNHNNVCVDNLAGDTMYLNIIYSVC